MHASGWSLLLGTVLSGAAVAAAAAGVAAPGSTAAADAPTAAVQAVWVPRELKFVYQGFTATYSCDGLQGRVRELLLKLGARKSDLKVYAMPCSASFGHPDSFPGVTVQMQVLEVVSAQNTSARSRPVAAHWQTVDLVPRRDPLNSAGECELLEQVKQSILPRFTTRNVDYQSSCVPHQLAIGAIRLKAQVLIADPTPTGEAGA